MEEFNHTIRIPKSLSHCEKNMVGNAVFRLFKNTDRINELKELSKEELFSKKKQIKVVFNKKFEDLLDYVCKEYNLSIQEAVTLGLILTKDDCLFFDNTKISNK